MEETKQQLQELFTAATMDHVGYTVPNLDEAIAFFTEILGFELLARGGPVVFPNDDRIAGWFDVHPRAAIYNAFLRHGVATKIELLAWSTPVQNTVHPNISDIGGNHLALAVADLDAAYASMTQHTTLRVLEKSERGFFIFFTPWGMPIQVVAAPR